MALLEDMPQYAPLWQQVDRMAVTLQETSGAQRETCPQHETTAVLIDSAPFLPAGGRTIRIDLLAEKTVGDFCSLVLAALDTKAPSNAYEIDVFDTDFDEFVRLDTVQQIQNYSTAPVRIRLVASAPEVL